ncbi:DNA alkylation repair protein [Chondrinema litorale]|uniref:DNA alkylation repair protein n=1 Tax=Chondrinema litorale TaxID=2994555 RepID=UPI0025430946|nr:DNA alkylation repair protein [Chondrinema litorale]UZR92302.1 DNA alkylation repair protein [Chondrinema litorale]
MFSVDGYLTNITEIFSENGNAKIAVQQSEYLKNKFDFYGLKSPLRKTLIKNFFLVEGYPPIEFIEVTIKSAYQYSQREMHYFAIEIAEKQKKYFNAKSLELIKWLIETNSWWDTVDLIASHLVGYLVKKYPELITVMDNWVESENMWIRRSALLFQLSYKQETDTERLFNYCTKLSGEKEFFIRKAVGWVLRQYAKTNPDKVIEFVNEQPLSNLSRKEALKHIDL